MCLVVLGLTTLSLATTDDVTALKMRGLAQAVTAIRAQGVKDVKVPEGMTETGINTGD